MGPSNFGGRGVTGYGAQWALVGNGSFLGEACPSCPSGDRSCPWDLCPGGRREPTQVGETEVVCCASSFFRRRSMKSPGAAGLMA